MNSDMLILFLCYITFFQLEIIHGFQASYTSLFFICADSMNQIMQKRVTGA